MSGQQHTERDEDDKALAEAIVEGRAATASTGAAGTRAAWCADHQHPGTTYHPGYDCTWCACGLACYPGDHARCGITCCGGPLDRHPSGNLDRPADPNQQEADRRRLADFLVTVAARRPQQLTLADRLRAAVTAAIEGAGQ